ncbi:MAG: hypothetical protein LBP52_01350 [Burkholderiaceae bacterium]|jgi:KDO2-lipid IV(A) lauroyltransferase|nr:hypothetical protein [Burkholderiaceae bacterium]
MKHWRFSHGFPLLARMPGALPWHLAAWLGHAPRAEQLATRNYLIENFARVFPGEPARVYAQWAERHLALLAREMMDAAALHRLGQPGGVRMEMAGWEHMAQLKAQGRGVIVVLTHFDRLMASLVGMAARGMTLNHLTMPIDDNAALEPAQRAFLSRKTQSLARILKGAARTTAESLRPVHKDLQAGQTWVIVADAWSPSFRRMREHAFLGGRIRLPTGIERLARATGAAMVQATTYSRAADRLSLLIEPLPAEPEVALDQVVARLERDVRQYPWAWWHWGVFNQMWTPPASSDCDGARRDETGDDQHG